MADHRRRLDELFDQFAARDVPDADAAVSSEVPFRSFEMMYDDQADRDLRLRPGTQGDRRHDDAHQRGRHRQSLRSRYGIVEYLTDPVFVLRNVRPGDFREARLAIEIQKIRDANHSRETKPYEITDTGISVYREANIF